MDYHAIRREITGRKILIGVGFALIMALALHLVILVFGRWKYMPVLFVLVALIFLLSEFAFLKYWE